MWKILTESVSKLFEQSVFILTECLTREATVHGLKGFRVKLMLKCFGATTDSCNFVIACICCTISFPYISLTI